MSLLVRDARVMTCDASRPGVGLVDDGAFVVDDGRIVWIGQGRDAPAADRTLSFAGRLVTPGLVDCHTHAIFAGDRANEFAMRAAGAGYLEIAAAGGGIAATLGPTRNASDDELAELLETRLDVVLAHGTTTIEVKSGYDLTVAGELRLLRCVARSAQTRVGPRIVPTLLAHLVPPERRDDRDVFVRELVCELVPAVARERLATSVDVYCDEGAFTLAEARAILVAAKTAGLAVRGHVGQFRDLGAADLLAELGALSGDHLEHVDDAGI
ncbi:MAG TPA: imidazolonepropionase, partial [Kofleriaceae bacterium]|nr:imidazolonepropionase [Kofleriaceae bacterium]